MDRPVIQILLNVKFQLVHKMCHKLQNKIQVKNWKQYYYIYEKKSEFILLFILPVKRERNKTFTI